MWVHASAEKLDSLGRVIDFSVLKDKVDTWIQLYWDHTFLCYQNDLEILALEPQIKKNKPWFICSFNPTAEEMAKYLFESIIPSLLEDTGVTVTRVVLYETENCKIEVY